MISLVIIDVFDKPVSFKIDSKIICEMVIFTRLKLSTIYVLQNLDETMTIKLIAHYSNLTMMKVSNTRIKLFTFCFLTSVQFFQTTSYERVREKVKIC